MKEKNFLMQNLKLQLQMKKVTKYMKQVKEEQKKQEVTDLY